MTVWFTLVFVLAILFSLLGFPGTMVGFAVVALLLRAVSPLTAVIALAAVSLAMVGEAIALHFAFTRGLAAFKAALAYVGTFILSGRLLGAWLGSGTFALLFGRDLMRFENPVRMYVQDLLIVRLVRVATTLIVGFGLLWLTAPAGG